MKPGKGTPPRAGNRRPPLHPATRRKIQAMRTAAAAPTPPEPSSQAVRLRSSALLTAALSLLYLLVSLGWSERQGGGGLSRGASPLQGEWGASLAGWNAEPGFSVCLCWPCDTSHPSPDECPRLFVSGVGSLRSPPAPAHHATPARRLLPWPSEGRVCRGRSGTGRPAPEGAAGSIAACGAVQSGEPVGDPGAAGRLVWALGWAAAALRRAAAGVLAGPPPTHREAARGCLRSLPGRWILVAGDSNARNMCVMLVEEVFGRKPWECSLQQQPAGGEGVGVVCWRTQSSAGRQNLWSDWDVMGGAGAGDMVGVRISFRFVGRDPAKVERIFSRPQDVHARYTVARVPRWEDPNGRDVRYLLNVSEPALRADLPPAQPPGPARGRRGGLEQHEPSQVGGRGGGGEDLPGLLAYASSLWGIWPHFHPQRIGATDLEVGGEEGAATDYDAAAAATGRATRGVDNWWRGVWEPTYGALRRYQERGGRVAYSGFGPVIGAQQQMTNLHAAMLNARVATNLSAVGVPFLDVMRLGLEAPREAWPDRYHLPAAASRRAIEALLSAACPT